MEVRLMLILCLYALITTGFTKQVKSKPEDLEDTYGALIDSESETDNVQNDDIDDYGGEDVANSEAVDKVEEIQVEFKTKPQAFIGDIGESVMLPCEVTKDVVVIWQKGTVILVQGHIMMNKFNNIKEYANNSLEVRLDKQEDYGEYACKIMIGLNNNPEIVHRVVKPVPPQIKSLTTAEGRTIYSRGESMTLMCNAIGKPQPEISWYKGGTGGERLGLKGNNITIENLTWKSAGMYRCLADNKYKPPSHKHIVINVEHEPIMQIEKFLVNSDKENDAELKCTVRAFPSATVVWKKNGQQLPNHRPMVTLKKNADNVESIMLLSNLKDEDFGEYACSAENKLGQVEKTINLVKTPAVQDFLKPEKNVKDVVLTWKVESKAPISKHELQYRKNGGTEWHTIEPEVTNGEQDVYTVKYEIKNLEDGNYETRLRSENVHGWSEFSPIMTFDSVLPKHGSTHKNHNKKHHKEKEVKDRKVTQQTTEGTPAQHHENEIKESRIGASQNAAYGLAPTSGYLLSSISLFLTMFLRSRQW